LASGRAFAISSKCNLVDESCSYVPSSTEAQVLFVSFLEFELGFTLELSSTRHSRLILLVNSSRSVLAARLIVLVLGTSSVSGSQPTCGGFRWTSHFSVSAPSSFCRAPISERRRRTDGCTWESELSLYILARFKPDINLQLAPLAPSVRRFLKCSFGGASRAASCQKGTGLLHCRRTCSSAPGACI
jgi:hypothetical protein